MGHCYRIGEKLCSSLVLGLQEKHGWLQLRFAVLGWIRDVSPADGFHRPNVAIVHMTAALHSPSFWPLVNICLALG